MTVATPELMLRSFANEWTLARWETSPADGELSSPTLPLGAPVARFFADAPDTTL